MNGWISFLMDETNLNQDMAIRRFCAARTEQEERGDSMEEAANNELDAFWSPDTTSSTTAQIGSSEEEFVDSFFNIDKEENHHESSKEENMFPCEEATFQDDDYLDTLLAMVNDIEGDSASSPVINEDGDNANDLLVASSDMVPLPSAINVEEAHQGSNGPADQGLHLVHLMLACAEAVGCRDTKLATLMLNQVWALANPWGDSLQRVCFCFAMGLKSRLSLVVGTNGIFNNADIPLMGISRAEKLDALQSLYQTTPYLAFGFMAANEAICQAAQGKEFDCIHIIDLGILGLRQWPSLIRTLASRPEGPPVLRITMIINEDIKTHPNHDLELQANMKALVDDANSLGMTLQLYVVTDIVTPALFTSEKLKLREGELLIVNSIMHLHKYVKESRGSLKIILQAIKKLSPGLVTVVEQDANHNGPFFLGRFLESLHYYSAIFDSLEASLARHSAQRFKIERMHFGEQIRNIVAYEGSDRIERHERADQWRRQLGRAGFRIVGLKCMSQIRMMLSVYSCDGYSLATDKGCLLLGWKGRPIMLASAWRVDVV
ncbi:Scarecrow-like transcription factor pat1 [Thalictrum thalictroides]|uniref:Scarecrow-like transcription factor pat1 n=1 Tax=Thalictrum thalictroides TaxID=46969 RepID=A0A7J6W522_THATH|nr:Scarecrow-like transcription factor pat1 [Thalictrum thalictroides]